MFVLIWATLLVSARGSSVTTATPHITNQTVTPDPAVNRTNSSDVITELLTKLLTTVKQPEVIIAFFIGIVFSSTLCCLARKCHRKKQKRSGNMVETLEMVASGDVEPKEVEYSNIDFSRWSPAGAQDTQGTTETEYAEIKKDGTEDRHDVGVEDSEKFEGSEEEVAMTGEDKETKQCLSPEREDMVDVAVYSSMDEIMPEI